MSKTQFSALTGFAVSGACAEPVHDYQESLRMLRTRGYCIYGQYPWDFWEKRALALGVPEDLAGLGRLLMREADQHAWSARLQSLCGWNDEGRRMIAFALRAPEKALERWHWLMDMDGLRLDPETYEWIGEEHWSWRPRKRRWLKDRRAAAALRQEAGQS